MRKFLDILIILAMGLCMSLAITHIRKQVVITDKDYIDAIVGEASNQSEDTMICVAHALRNRRNLEGVYGYHAKHNAKETKDTWYKAALAWSLSAFESDTTQGSKNWGTIDDLEQMDQDVTVKVQCGDLLFY